MGESRMLGINFNHGEQGRNWTMKLTLSQHLLQRAFEQIADIPL
jgi:hypothetical protein